jgi:hypothetical protein
VTGVGRGQIRFKVDGDGRPASFQFEVRDSFHNYPIAIGRPEGLSQAEENEPVGQKQEITPPSQTGANAYTFTHSKDATEIVYFPHRLGLLERGESAIGAELRYKGPEGFFTFLSDEMDIREGPIGSLISVTLGGTEISGGSENFLRFSLVLPPVKMGETKQQSLQTFGIKTFTTTGGITEGAQYKYSLLQLKGLAEIVGPPL